MKKLYFLLITVFAINFANAQWQTQYNIHFTDVNIQYREFYSVYFTDANTGYIVGGHTCLYNQTILFTYNGGSQWWEMTDYIDNGSWVLYSVHFPDANTGYVVGRYETIRKTTDGGITWTDIEGVFGADWSSVYFTSPDTGYVAGNIGIIKTTNGGTNWVIQNNYYTLYSIYFTYANVGYAVGANGVILKTTDGGTNWIEQASGTTNTLHSVNFGNANNGYAVGANGVILKTTDGGTNWTKQTSGTTQYITSVNFITKDLGYAVGNNGTILKTIDGGANWKSQSGITDDLNSVYFTDANTGYAVGDNGIYKTTNGGSNWIEEKRKEDKLKIYPNPANTEITIETPQMNKIYDLRICNLRGQELIKQQTINLFVETDNKQQIDISGLPSGVYFIKVIDKENVNVCKFIKE